MENGLDDVKKMSLEDIKEKVLAGKPIKAILTYSESFIDEAHLKQIQDEAQAMVRKLF